MWIYLTFFGWTIPPGALAIPLRVHLRFLVYFWFILDFVLFLSFWASKMYPKKKVLVNVIPWTDQVEEIRSCNVRIDRNLTINIISKSFAIFLGCRVISEEPTLALVKYEPVKLVGKTHILLRLPKSKRKLGKFTKI